MKKRLSACFRALFAILSVILAATPVLAAVPDDTLFKEQGYLAQAGLPDAWNFAKGSPTVTVAVIDSGVDLEHPDLADRVWKNAGEIPGDGVDDDRNGYVDDVHGWDFVDNDNRPDPAIRARSSQEGVHHGTLVAGVIGAAGNNAQGITGVNWNVRIMPLRVLDSEGAGGTAAVEAAIRYAVAKKARVINISLSGATYSTSLAETLRDAYRAGAVIVVAAGNEGDTERGGNLNVYPSYPACYKGAAGEPILLGVSSLDAQGRRSSFSSYGSNCISVSAPGENILTTQAYRPAIAGYDEPYGSGWSGSSLAAPVVSGVAALLLSLDPALTPAQVRTLITGHATNIDSINGGYAGQLGTGMINAAESVQALVATLLNAPTPAAPPPLLPPASADGGELVKAPAFSAVYYKARDGKRYVFPNAKTYASWFSGFASVRTVTSAELASLSLGGTVTYRPGTRLLKLRTRPEVYAVSKGGVLRHVASEAVARDLYGSNWRLMVDDLPDEFFAGYRLGAPVTSASAFDVSGERAAAPTIEADRGL